jgi:hypothetical protein
MSKTSLKLPVDIEEKTCNSGAAPHASMIETIGKDMQATEKQTGFINAAQTARSMTLESGLGYSASDVHQHLLDRINKKIDATKSKNAVVHTTLTAYPWRA